MIYLITSWDYLPHTSATVQRKLRAKRQPIAGNSTRKLKVRNVSSDSVHTTGVVKNA